MTSGIVLPLVLLAVMLPGAAQAKSVEEILEAAWEAEGRRGRGLDSYLVEQVVMGRDVKQYFLRATLIDAVGRPRSVFVPAPTQRVKGSCVNLASLRQDPTNDTNFLAWFRDGAALVGEESIDGTPAWHVRSDGVGKSATINGDSVTMNSVSLWLSKDDYTTLKYRLEGEARNAKGARPVTIESLQKDFRTVPGTDLRQPFRRLASVSGLMQGTGSAQVAEARARLEEMEAQLASMPPSQRKMMEERMGPQLETMRQLARSGAIETEILIRTITPNPEVDGRRVTACDAG